MLGGLQLALGVIIDSWQTLWGGRAGQCDSQITGFAVIGMLSGALGYAEGLCTSQVGLGKLQV